MTIPAPTPPAVEPAPELLDALRQVSAGSLAAEACVQGLLDALDQRLSARGDDVGVAQARSVGEALALRSLGVRGPAASDAEPRGTPGVPHDEMLQEKFRVTSPEIRHPLHVLGASSFLVTLLSQPIQADLKDGVERVIAQLKADHPIESAIRDHNITEW